MNETKPLLVFSIFALLAGFSTMAFAGDQLVVSNIGSSGDDGIEAESVPPWIKTTMGYWVDGHVTDKEFLNAVEYLAGEEIIRVSEPTSVSPNDSGSTSGTTGQTGTVDIEMVSMNSVMEQIKNHEERHAEIEDARYNLLLGATEQAAPDSFFDIFIELQESADSFFDVFFEVDTPRTSECLRDQELMFDERTSSWECSSANTVDSFFDVFFDVATETSQNSEDIEELERKITLLEEQLAGFGVEREMKESGTG